ncbi:hypothetical protein KAR91_13700 [Candidatus Pacearchaeota archaeon]|nr:hypothetical protein [Candidatus Pacearchaeota archaeon]
MLEEQFAAIDWYTVGVNAVIFVLAMITGLGIGFTAGRNFAIERMSVYINARKDRENTPNES